MYPGRSAASGLFACTRAASRTCSPNVGKAAAIMLLAVTKLSQLHGGEATSGECSNRRQKGRAQSASRRCLMPILSVRCCPAYDAALKNFTRAQCAGCQGPASCARKCISSSSPASCPALPPAPPSCAAGTARSGTKYRGWATVARHNVRSANKLLLDGIVAFWVQGGKLESRARDQTAAMARAAIARMALQRFSPQASWAAAWQPLQPRC